MSSAPSLSRRELFSRFFARGQETPARGVRPTAISGNDAGLSRVAIVQGRFCLAYQRSFCTTCVERCPVPGAVVIEQHVPRIVPDLCTGCGICHQVCPAPRNAILMKNRGQNTERFGS